MHDISTTSRRSRCISRFRTTHTTYSNQESAYYARRRDSTHRRCATHHHKGTDVAPCGSSSPPSPCVPKRMPLWCLFRGFSRLLHTDMTHSNLNLAHYARRGAIVCMGVSPVRVNGARAGRDSRETMKWVVNDALLVLIMCPFTPLHDGDHLGSR